MNVIDALRHHSRMRPFDLAVIHPTGAANYLQLAQAVSQLSLRLRSHGIEPGATVALYVSDPYLHLALALAAMVNGAASISAHPNYDPVPAAAGTSAFLADRELPFATTAPVIAVGPNWIADAGNEVPRLAGPGYPGAQALCRVYASSGTTGQPKAIGQSVGALAAMTVRSLSMETQSRGPNLSMIWFGAVGGFGTAHSALWHGTTVVLATAPLQVLRAINLYAVASLRAAPQQLQALVQLAAGRAVRFPSLQRVEVAGAALPAALLMAARSCLCNNIVGGYGSTEAGGIAQAPTALLQARPDAAGYVRPDVQVRIVDEAGQDLPAGREGMLWVRTPYMTDRYLGDPQASAQAFRDGWFLPGDIGILEPDGVLRITGRADEMINAGGVKLSPAVVDEFLLAQPGVRDAAAFAHRQGGQADQVWAAVVCDDRFDGQAVLAAARAQLVSRAPVRLVPMALIPRNAMGKPLRQQLSRDTQSL